MAEELKKKRISAKRAVSREINQAKQLVAEDENHEVLSEKVVKLKHTFKTVTTIHDQYTDLLTDDNEIEESDKYFNDVQTEYINVLKEVKEALSTAESKVKKETSFASNPDEITREELLSLVHMPKLELEVFNGNPLKYHQFAKAFDQNVDKVTSDSDNKLARLVQYTTGEAKEAIKGCLLIAGDEGYKYAREILQKIFGNPHLVTEHVVKEMRSGKPARSPKDIQQLADDMRNAEVVLKKLNTLKEVDSQTIILEIINRLPTYIQIRWKKKALQIKNDTDIYPDFVELVQFITLVAEEVNDPVYGKMTFRKTDISKQKSSFVTSASPSTCKQDTSPGRLQGDQTRHPRESYQRQGYRQSHYHRPEPPCVLCSQRHRLWHCDDFKKMTPKQRLDLVNQHKLCHNCLLASHEVKYCGKRSVCSIEGCGRKHTRFIHIDVEQNNDNSSNVSNFACSKKHKVHMPIVQITVNDSQKVYALLDAASSNSFCSWKLVRDLGISGKNVEYKLNTLQGSHDRISEYVSLSIQGENNEILDMSQVYVVDCIPVCNSVVDVHKYPHLKDIPLCKCENNVTVDILIGLDHTEALVPLEVRTGNKGEPFAMKTLLGWCISGNTLTGKPSNQIISHFISTSTIEEDVNKLWKLENEGLDGYGNTWSQEDKQVISMWDREVQYEDGHFVLPIPWKNRNEPLPNNFVIARSRLDSS